jgi:hypothetical protein
MRQEAPLKVSGSTKKLIHRITRLCISICIFFLPSICLLLKLYFFISIFNEMSMHGLEFIHSYSLFFFCHHINCDAFFISVFMLTNLRGEWCKQKNWICWYMLSIVRHGWWCKALFHLPKHRRYKEINRSQPLRARSWCSFYFSKKKTLNLNPGQG